MLKKIMITTMVLVVMLSVNANAKEIKNQLNNESVTVDQISDSEYVLNEDELGYLELGVSVSCNEVNRIEVRDTDDRQLEKSGSIYYVDAIENGYNNVNVEVGYYTNTKSVDIEVWDNFGELLYFGQTEINVEHPAPVVETVSENSVSQNTIEYTEGEETETTISANTVEADNTEVEEVETTEVKEVVETTEVEEAEEYDNDAADDSWNEESEVVVAREVNEAPENVDDDIDVDDDEVKEVKQEQIVVVKPSVSSKLSKNKLKVKIKADKGTKLEIKYSVNGKTWKTKTYSASAKNINFKFKKKNLKIKVKVRAYKVVNGNKIYSNCISISKKCK